MDGDIKSAVEAAFASVDQKLTDAITKYEAQVKDTGTAATEAKAAVVKLSEDFTKLQADVKDVAQKALEGFKGGIERPQTMGEQLVSADQFKSFVAGNAGRVRIETKAAVSTVVADGTTAFSQQSQAIVPGAFKPLTIRQVIPTAQASGISVIYRREKTWTNAAAGVTQAAAKPLSAIEFEMKTLPIEVVAHIIKLSKQLLADAPAVATYVDTRMRDGLAQTIDAQLLTGNGTSPNLSGLYDAGNFTAYTATAGDLLTDAINRAKYTLWAAGYVPDVVVVNPADWGAMEIKKASTAGTYLYGLPGMNAGMNPFGVQVVLSPNMTAGQFLVSAIRSAAILWERQGVTIEMFEQDSDNVEKNLVTVRAETRLGLAVEVPAAQLGGAFTA